MKDKGTGHVLEVSKHRRHSKCKKLFIQQNGLRTLMRKAVHHDGTNTKTVSLILSATLKQKRARKYESYLRYKFNVCRKPQYRKIVMKSWKLYEISCFPCRRLQCKDGLTGCESNCLIILFIGLFPKTNSQQVRFTLKHLIQKSHHPI